MPGCSFFGCKLSGVHAFPKNDLVMKQKWERATRKKGFIATKSSRICRNHFKESDYIISELSTGRVTKKLKKDAVPSIFTWKAISTNKQNQNDNERESCVLNLNQDIYSPTGSISEENINDQESEVSHIPKTEIEISSSIFPIDVLKNNTMMLYYTGLQSYVKFAHILNTLTPHCYDLEYGDPEVRKLTVSDYLLLTLMKLRRNTPNTELMFLFGLSTENISNIFAIWIKFIYEIWSERYFVKFSVPEPFGTDYKEILIKKSCSPFMPEVIEENLNDVDSILDIILKGKSSLRLKSNLIDKSYVITSLIRTFKILGTDMSSYSKPLASQIIFACLMIHSNLRDNIVKAAISNVS